MNIRARFESALAGEPVEWPVYAVYDWFVNNRPAVDWQSLFEQGLGRIQHADLVRHERPNLQVVETQTQQDGRTRRDVRWITDRGELHEWYLGEWRQEHFIKCPDDYRIMCRALEGTRSFAISEPFEQAEAEVGQRGITVGQLGRTPLMHVQIDLAGLERFALDLAEKLPEQMELLELLGDIFIQELQAAAQTPARYVKLWENLTIESIGLAQYRRRLVPLYHKLFEIFAPSGKRLLVHYDGRLRLIADEIAELDIDGIDSFTPAPEGDMTPAEGRACWPDKFLWMHPPLGWYEQPREELVRRIERMADEAGPRRFCLMISEDVPPDWQRTVPIVLETLARRR